MSLRLARGIGSAGEALGRSRGGLGTKVVRICDAAGRLIDFMLVPGQAHEQAPSLTLLRRLPPSTDLDAGRHGLRRRGVPPGGAREATHSGGALA